MGSAVTSVKHKNNINSGSVLNETPEIMKYMAGNLFSGRLIRARPLIYACK
jgi:hypothetical protein